MSGNMRKAEVGDMSELGRKDASVSPEIKGERSFA
jgi:hypothetical protein